MSLILLLAGAVVAQTARNSTVSTAANMALIPGGTFEMGQNETDIPKLQKLFNVNRAELFAEETPKHKVTIGSFYLDKTEVTNADFGSFVGQNTAWQKAKIAAAYHNGKYLQHWNGNDFPVGQGNYPVVYVSWYAATAFCQAQGKRLPTETEWEYAARGGLEEKAFPWGDQMPDKTLANFSEGGIDRATAVASYPANGYGLYDMAGNVWEYLADEWKKYPLGSKANPAIASGDSSYLAVKSRRALRGGSYGGSPVNLRVTYRDSHLPENAGNHVGFRCAMTNRIQSEDVNELLRMHHRDRAAHFNRDAGYIFSNFADEYFSVGNGLVRIPDREAGRKGLQGYFDATTFLEWDDITPPIVRVSNDGTLAYSIVNKKVSTLSKDQDGAERRSVNVYAWIATFRNIGGKWKVTSVASTAAPEAKK